MRFLFSSHTKFLERLLKKEYVYDNISSDRCIQNENKNPCCDVCKKHLSPDC
jgi:hypothetical protein